jgi:hypothetical protein
MSKVKDLNIRLSRWWRNTPLMISRQRKIDWTKSRQVEIGTNHILEALSDPEFKKAVVTRMRKKFEIPNFTVDQEIKAYNSMVSELSKEVITRYASSN